MIRLENVSKIYDNGIEVLKNVNLEVAPGEFAFIVGTSGAGKSTLVKLLLKEENPTSGKIFLQGEDITKVRNRRIPYIRRMIGTVFQDFRLLPQKTVYENVSFAMEVMGKSPRDIRRTVPIILALVGLSNRASAYPNQLSGGEHQRVAIARAIVNNPPLLIADEPTGNLDPDTAWEVMTTLRDINARGTTILMVTHAKDIVDKMGKRVITIKSGCVDSDIVGGVYNNVF